MVIGAIAIQPALVQYTLCNWKPVVHKIRGSSRKVDGDQTEHHSGKPDESKLFWNVDFKDGRIKCLVQGVLLFGIVSLKLNGKFSFYQ